MTLAQTRTIDALAPEGSEHNVQGYSVKMPGTLMVQFLTPHKGYADVLGQYIIHPGGSYVGAATAIPAAWYDPTQYNA